MNVDFKKEFMDFNFDDILLQSNNSLVNSYVHYTSHKQQYIKETLENFRTLTFLNQNLDEICKIKCSSGSCKTKVHVTILDGSGEGKLRLQIKAVVLKQRKLFANLINYINFLNENEKVLIGTEASFNQNAKIKTIFSKLMQSKKK
jgi:hypothetical protein